MAVHDTPMILLQVHFRTPSLKDWQGQTMPRSRLTVLGVVAVVSAGFIVFMIGYASVDWRRMPSSSPTSLPTSRLSILHAGNHPAYSAQDGQVVDIPVFTVKGVVQRRGSAAKVNYGKFLGLVIDKDENAQYAFSAC
jgi:hypothetical protein